MTDEKRREKPLKEKRYLYYIYNNLYVHVRNSVGNIGNIGNISKKINEFILCFALVLYLYPFIDGNGRMGRLWQSLILGKLHPVFEHLPVENMVYSNQQQYYDAITASSKAAQSGPFIDFMLREIYNTLIVS